MDALIKRAVVGQIKGAVSADVGGCRRVRRERHVVDDTEEAQRHRDAHAHEAHDVELIPARAQVHAEALQICRGTRRSDARSGE